MPTAKGGELWRDLLVSMIAVAGFPLGRAYALGDGFEHTGLTDPHHLGELTEREIAVALAEAGYTRGPFMAKVIATRFASLASLIASHGATECEAVLGGHDASAIERFLAPVEGVGPVVLRTFYALRGLSPPVEKRLGGRHG